MDFEKHNKLLEDCIEKAAGSKNWKGEGERCFGSYSSKLRGDIDKEINRIMRDIKIWVDDLIHNINVEV